MGWHAMIRGEQSPHAKLTESDVRRIRQRRTELKVPYAELAREHCVHPRTVMRICLRQSWAHVP